MTSRFEDEWKVDACMPTVERKPRIALVADVDKWAFANIARSMADNLRQEYEISIFYSQNYQTQLENLVDDLFSQNYDLIHFFWREDMLDILPALSDHAKKYAPNFLRARITFSIYDHCFLDSSGLQRLRSVFNFIASGYTVSSEKLMDIYSAIAGFARPEMVIADGVDLALFYPKPMQKELASRNKLIVGWVGNSRWRLGEDGSDHKGLHTLIKPAIAALQKAGVPIVGQFADSSSSFIPLEQMVDYYNAVDVYVCASDIEGTPNPVLEAMACGKPVISTDVGIVPQLFGTRQQEFILPERSQQALEEKLLMLACDAELRAALAKENLQRINNWTRQKEADKWRSFFTAVLTADDREVALNGNEQATRLPQSVLKGLLLEMPFGYYGDRVTLCHSSLSWRITAPLRKIGPHIGKLWNRLALRAK